jgi:ketosteroid isomerase-like protein
MSKNKLLAGSIAAMLCMADALATAEPARGLPASAAAAKAAASPENAELAAFKKAIRARYAIKEKAFAEHDAETIVTQFYTADVFSVGDGEGIFVGRDQIRPLYQEVVKDNKVKIDSVNTFVNGSAGWDWADFNVTPTDGKTKPFTFAILFLWTKIDGVWMCKGDFFVRGSFRSGKLAPPEAPAK